MIDVKYQVNLYRPELLPKPIPLAFKSIACILAVVITILVLIGVRQQWQLHILRDTLSSAQNEQNSVAAQLTDFEQRYQPIQLDQALQDELVARERELEQKNVMLQLLENHHEGAGKGFSSFLIGLSHQHLQGLWLQEIIIDADFHLSLFGNVIDAKLLPRYLEGLSGEPIFHNQSFRAFKMSQPEALAAVTEAITNNSSTKSTVETLRFELRSEVSSEKNIQAVAQ